MKLDIENLKKNLEDKAISSHNRERRPELGFVAFIETKSRTPFSQILAHKYGVYILLYDDKIETATMSFNSSVQGRLYIDLKGPEIGWDYDVEAYGATDNINLYPTALSRLYSVINSQTGVSSSILIINDLCFYMYDPTTAVKYPRNYAEANINEDDKVYDFKTIITEIENIMKTTRKDD